MKRQVLLAVVIVILTSLACSLESISPSESPTKQPAPTQTPLPPVIIQVTPTKSPNAAELANSGTHQYWMSPNEITCDASDETNFAQVREKTHIFSSDFNSVDYGGRDYTYIGDHRYQSINQSNRPLVLEYSEHGFILFVYDPGTDTSVDDWCLTFSFTLRE